MKSYFQKSLLLGFLALSVAGCIRFHPRPLSPARDLADFEARSLEGPELANFCRSQLGMEKWPPPVWDMHALTLAAIFFHPDLDVARAQWGVARAGRITAGERPNPAVSVLMGYNSTSPIAEVTPWIPEAALEIPIETAGKRGYRIAQARHLSEAARLNILSTAWEVRRRLRQAYLDLFSARETESLLDQQQSIQADSLRILEAQMAAGEASAYDVTSARIALVNSRLAALDAARQHAQARIQLASALGLPVRALDGIQLSFAGLLQIPADIPASHVRLQALQNRADILGALAEYEACQSALRIEIAKQYPDFNFGPDYQLDQVDSKWTLALSLLLPIFNRNRGPIAEAEARRTEAAARFLALQAKAIGEIEAAAAACQSAALKAKTANELQEGLHKQEKTAQARYELGEISKLELLGIRMELAAGSLARLDSLVKTQQAVGELEDAMQSPLDLREWVRAWPARIPSQAKEKKNE